VLVSAEIQPFDGNYRDAKEKVQQFTALLKHQDTVSQVEIIAQPNNANAQQDLRGSTSSTENERIERAVFKIKLQLKATPS
jgi:hypothetical protein